MSDKPSTSRVKRAAKVNIGPVIKELSTSHIDMDVDIGKDFNHYEVREFMMAEDIRKYDILPQKRNPTTAYIVSAAEHVALRSEFDVKHPELSSKSNDINLSTLAQKKIADAKVFCMLLDRYCNSVVDCPKFENEECNHANVKVVKEQTRCLDEMESLTRFCLDCGDISMQT